MNKIKKAKFPVSILIVLLILLGLVIYIGSYSFQKFSSIVNEVSEASRADSRLLKTKNLSTRITLAENSVKTYGLTKDSIYLDLFYLSIQKTDELMDILYQLESSTSKKTKLDLPFLDSMIGIKFKILQDYLNLQDDYRVDIALDKVVHNIEHQIKKEKRDKLKQEIQEEQVQKEIETKNQNEKIGFLKRIFGKKKENVEKPKEKVITKKEKVEFKEIDSEVEIVKKEEKRINENKVAQELQLIMDDKSITEKIDSMIIQFELNENIRVSKEAEEASVKVKSVHKQLIVFFVIAGVLVFFIALLILNYVYTSNRFRKALRKAKKEAEQLAETKERFLNNMSHEIRTPMNAISGFVDQLAKSNLDAEKAEQVQMIQKSANHLLHIIDEVLIFNKLHNKKTTLDKRAFDINGLTNDIFQLLKPLADSKGIKLKLIINPAVPKILKGDPHKLNQILINVMGNAIKFTKEGSVTLVMNSPLKGEDDCHVRFEIIDTGIGMNNEQLTRIFNEFEQAEVSTTRDFGGTGLGLSITKMLVDLYQGSIDVESKIGKGSKFSIELPFEIGNEDDIYVIREETPKNRELQNLRILIVDDEPYNRKLLFAILNKHKVNLSEASNGREAINELKRNKYDLILMDSRMPEMSGIEATEIIRRSKNPDVKDIPIIALSAAVSENDQKMYKNAGMNDFLPKPFKESELIKKINLLVNNGTTDFAEKIMQKQTQNNGDAHLNFQQLLDISNGDKAFFSEMLQTFVDETKSGVEALKEELANENWRMLAEYAHKISSPCNHLSATKLYNLLKELENGIRDEELSHEQIPMLVQQIEAESVLVLDEVKTKLSEVLQK